MSQVDQTAERSSPTGAGRRERPLILATNDDGVLAKGLAALVDAMAEIGDVIVAAPDTERSGTSHAMTFHTHLRAQEVRQGWWSVSGTPVDCVYFGLNHLCEDAAPDLVVSGINHGFNLGTDVFYSGTVGAAAEAYLRGCPAMAISAERGFDPRWSTWAAKAIARRLLHADQPALLSVNVPHPPRGVEFDDDKLERFGRGTRFAVTRLGRRSYLDAVERRTDPQGRPYYWIGGPPTELSGEPGDDLHAVGHGMVAVTPLELDITAPDLSPAHSLLRGDDAMQVAPLREAETT